MDIIKKISARFTLVFTYGAIGIFWIMLSDSVLLYFVKDISAGETITADAVRSIRPSNGLHPKYLKEIIGMIASKDISYGTPTTWEVIKKQK